MKIEFFVKDRGVGREDELSTAIRREGYPGIDGVREFEKSGARLLARYTPGPKDILWKVFV